MFERFSHGAREVVVQAQVEARSLGHRWVGTEHLLIGLASRDATVPGRLLAAAGADAQRLRDALVAVLSDPPPDEDGLDAEALRSIGIDLDAVRRRTDEVFGPGALDRPVRSRPRRHRWSRCGLPFLGRDDCGHGPRGGHLPFTARAKKALELSLRWALKLDHRGIGAEHVLLGVLVDRQALAAHLLERLGIDPRQLRDDLLATVS